MADYFWYYKICGICGGDGVITAPDPLDPDRVVRDIPCNACDGKGGHKTGWFEPKDDD